MYLLIGVSVQNNVAIFMNKYELAKKINELEGLTNQEKSELLQLLRSQKKYGLVWEDKPEDIEQRMLDNLPVLVEVPERAILSDDAEAPNHILIEGDNLEALIALSYTHTGKIDVIYIDPPYNTGNKDFVYNDSYVDKEDGYRHSKWLSFMNKRLSKSKSLLRDNGVIFISIGSDEVAQLTLLCNEIFGEDNQIAIVSRVQKRGNGKGTHFSPAVDYVLAYANNKSCVSRFFAPNTSDFPVLETEGERAGEYYECTKSLYQGSLDSRPNQRYYIECPDHSFIIPPGNIFPDEVRDAAYVKPNDNNDKCWRWSWDSYLKQKHLLVFKKVKKSTLVDENGNQSKWNVYTKRYQKDAEEKGKVPPNYIDDCINSLGTSRLGELSLDFSFSKPCELLKKLVNYTNKGKDILILDFFAGSGTSLDATMQLNAKDGGHRQCILVTNNENGICENVTYERNRRVIQGYTTPKGEKVPGLTRNNLRYYKTKFVPRDKSPKNLRNLMALSTDMLCIHNDTYIEKSFAGKNINNKIARYFESNDGTKRMLVIYRAEAIQVLVELMKQEFKNAESKENGKLMVYVFSPNGYAYDDEFEDVADYVSLCAMPDAVLNAYRRVLPKKRQAQLLDDVAEETDSEARTVEESDLFQNQTYTMAASEIKDNREGGDE